MRLVLLYVGPVNGFGTWMAEKLRQAEKEGNGAGKWVEPAVAGQKKSHLKSGYVEKTTLTTRV